jgi:uncharacterized protein YcnI
MPYTSRTAGPAVLVATRRAVLVAAGAAMGLLALAVPAAAHVTVSPPGAVQGESSRVAFQVPAESDAAMTTKVEVFLPLDAPVPSVAALPVPGWTLTTQMRKLERPIEIEGGAQISEVVSTLTWSAAGDASIKPGQFQEFAVLMGPLPKVEQIVFKVLQTYSDGTVVRWIEVPGGNGTEPEHPAPVLKLASAAAAAGPTTSGDRADSDPVARTLGTVGTLLAAATLALVLLRQRRPGR